MTIAAAPSVAAQPLPTEKQQPLVQVRELVRAGELTPFGSALAASHGTTIAIVTDDPTSLFIAMPGQETLRKPLGALVAPIAVAWTHSGGWVLDVSTSKLVSLDGGGKFGSYRSLDAPSAREAAITSADTLLLIAEPFARTRSFVRISDSRIDTIISIEMEGRRIKLTSDDAPSLTVGAPFHSATIVRLLTGGDLAIWSPSQPEVIRRVSPRGTERKMATQKTVYAVEDSDEELWIQAEIPHDFMGRPVFEPLRRVARRTLLFPSKFPPVLDFADDPSGRLWVRRTTAGQGEVWDVLRADGRLLGSTRLRSGCALLEIAVPGVVAKCAVNSRSLVALFDLPRWLRPTNN